MLAGPVEKSIYECASALGKLSKQIRNEIGFSSVKCTHFSSLPCTEGGQGPLGDNSVHAKGLKPLERDAVFLSGNDRTALRFEGLIKSDAIQYNGVFTLSETTVFFDKKIMRDWTIWKRCRASNGGQKEIANCPSPEPRSTSGQVSVGSNQFVYIDDHFSQLFSGRARVKPSPAALQALKDLRCQSLPSTNKKISEAIWYVENYDKHVSDSAADAVE